MPPKKKNTRGAKRRKATRRGTTKKTTAPRTKSSVGAEGSGQMAIGGARTGASKVVSPRDGPARGL
jgi:hypothetical protein